MPGERFWSSCNRFCHTNLCLLLLMIFGAGLTVAGSGAGAVLVIDRDLRSTQQEQVSVAEDLKKQIVLEGKNYDTLMLKLDGIEEDVGKTKADVAVIKFRQDQAEKAPRLGAIRQYFNELAKQ